MTPFTKTSFKVIANNQEVGDTMQAMTSTTQTTATATTDNASDGVEAETGAPTSNPPLLLEEAQRAKEKPEPELPINSSGTTHGGHRPGAGRKPRRTTPVLPGNEKPDAPPTPFVGGAPVVPPANASATPNELLKQMVAAPDSMADIAIVAIDGAVIAVATWRYGEDEGKTVRAKDEAKKEIRKALLQYIELASVKMTPGQAVFAAIVAAYAPTVLEYELSGKALRGPGAKKK